MAASKTTKTRSTLTGNALRALNPSAPFSYDTKMADFYLPHEKEEFLWRTPDLPLLIRIGIRKGFGNKLGEYWLGLDAIHALTSQGSYRLRVDMEDFEGNTRYAEYDSFNVADEADNYRLSIGIYAGTAGDSLSYHKGMEFSTKDRDNDAATTRSCAVLYPSGWWHNNCHKCNPNGMYLNGKGSEFSKGVTWYHWLGHKYSLKRMAM
ncbi:hypothetical protein QZH41_006127 [Actinostola sp. cb2023]|nr:hypothetical protein QZH41_006127 [Actinostola sp. cb2023]